VARKRQIATRVASTFATRHAHGTASSRASASLQRHLRALHSSGPGTIGTLPTAKSDSATGTASTSGHQKQTARTISSRRRTRHQNGGAARAAATGTRDHGHAASTAGRRIARFHRNGARIAARSHTCGDGNGSRRGAVRRRDFHRAAGSYRSAAAGQLQRAASHSSTRTAGERYRATGESALTTRKCHAAANTRATGTRREDEVTTDTCAGTNTNSQLAAMAGRCRTSGHIEHTRRTSHRRASADRHVATRARGTASGTGNVNTAAGSVSASSAAHHRDTATLMGSNGNRATSSAKHLQPPSGLAGASAHLHALCAQTHIATYRTSATGNANGAASCTQLTARRERNAATRGRGH